MIHECNCKMCDPRSHMYGANVTVCVHVGSSCILFNKADHSAAAACMTRAHGPLGTPRVRAARHAYKKAQRLLPRIRPRHRAVLVRCYMLRQRSHKHARSHTRTDYQFFVCIDNAAVALWDEDLSFGAVTDWACF